MEKDVRKNIATDIYQSGWLLRECSKICPKDKELSMDLFQEIMLIILEFKPSGLLQTAWDKKQHLPFIKKIILNQYNSVTSPFYKKYRKFAASELFDETYNEEDND